VADQLWLDYLRAGCWRQQGKLKESLALYRELAENKEDAFLSESATWQMNFLTWRLEMQAQIEELQKRTP
jgi:hypothetical protein